MAYWTVELNPFQGQEICLKNSDEIAVVSDDTIQNALDRSVIGVFRRGMFNIFKVQGAFPKLARAYDCSYLLW